MWDTYRTEVASIREWYIILLWFFFIYKPSCRWPPSTCVSLLYRRTTIYIDYSYNSIHKIISKIYTSNCPGNIIYLILLYFAFINMTQIKHAFFVMLVIRRWLSKSLSRWFIVKINFDSYGHCDRLYWSQTVRTLSQVLALVGFLTELIING